MIVLDSRRLTGPSLVLDRPGAVLEVQLEEPELSRAIAAWRRSARTLLDALAWTGEMLSVRRFPGGASLALSAPVDALYAATDLNELAWEAALAEIRAEPGPDLAVAVEPIRERAAEEANPALLALRDAALERNLTFLSDEDGVSVGSGTGVLVWEPDSVPAVDEVDWSRVHDISIVLVTGSNGKTTVVRLLAALVAGSNSTPGYTSTEGVTIGSTQTLEGDFSGPSGARAVLRDSRVETAILETARGGILRRGLAVDHADVAVVTNVAEDHLGEFGVQSLEDLAETKLLVAKALGPGGTLVLNGDDKLLVERSANLGRSTAWFSLDSASTVISTQAAAGGTAVVLDGDEIVIRKGGERLPVIAARDVPITFGGSARHNVANVLAAVAAATALKIEIPQMAAVLRRFGRNPADNPGRANLVELGGARLLIDYAHNPHGMSALVRVAETLDGNRRLVMLGQAGDRDDEAIRELARAAWALRPDHIIVKDMDQFLRGRPRGEVRGLLAEEFSKLGASKSAVSLVGPDLEGVRQALAWARPGDLLVLTIHQDRRAVLDLISRLGTMNWRAGDPLPA